MRRSDSKVGDNDMSWRARWRCEINGI